MSIEWIGDFKAPSGYGRACRADLRALIKAGVTPAVRIHQHDRTQMDLSKDVFWGPRVADLLSPQREHPDIVVWQETPEFYRPDPTCKNVARIEWETSKIVDYDHADDPTHNWVTQLNAMSEVWVASQFVADVLASSGVTTPSHVIPHPTDLKTFCPGERRYIGGPPGKEANRGRFTALALFQWTARKAPEDLLTAWSRSSLGKREDCCLLLKTYGADFTDVTRIVQHISVFRQMLNIPGLVTNVYPITSLILEKDMPDMYRTADVFLSPSRGEGFNMPCHPPGTPVVTADGTRPIEEVCNGDSVVTHTGRTRSVTGSTVRSYSGPMVWLRPKGCPAPIGYTPDHKVLVSLRRKRMTHTASADLCPTWIKAAEVRVGDYMVVPKMVASGPPVTSILISDYVPGLVHEGEHVYFPMSFRQHGGASLQSIASVVGCGYQTVSRILRGDRSPHTDLAQAVLAEAESQKYSRPPHILVRNKIDLTPEVMEVFGLYIAEGCVGSEGNAAMFASHLKEQGIRDLERHICESVFNAATSEGIKKNHLGVGSCVTASSRVAGQTLKALFGSHAYNKHINPILLRSPNLGSLLRGYFRGDGCLRYMSASTASTQLWHDLYVALNLLGIYTTRHMSSTRGLGNYPEHTISVPPQFYDVLRVTTGLRGVSMSASGRRNRCVVEGPNAFYVPVRCVEVTDHEGPVHNLHVDTDESYIAGGYASHNCAEAMACGVPAVFTNRTAHSEFAVGYPVECHAVPVTGMPHIPWYSAEQDWWQIDALDFVAKLEEAYADWKTGRLKELGVEARQAAEALHSDERVGSLLRERCEALSPQAV